MIHFSHYFLHEQPLVLFCAMPVDEYDFTPSAYASIERSSEKNAAARAMQSKGERET